MKRAVFSARRMGLIPHTTGLRPVDKLNLRPMFEDAHLFEMKSIDTKSGIIVARDPQFTYSDIIMKQNMLDPNPDKNKPYF